MFPRIREVPQRWLMIYVSNYDRRWSPSLLMGKAMQTVKTCALIVCGQWAYLLDLDTVDDPTIWVCVWIPPVLGLVQVELALLNDRLVMATGNLGWSGEHSWKKHHNRKMKIAGSLKQLDNNFVYALKYDIYDIYVLQILILWISFPIKWEWLPHSFII